MGLGQIFGDAQSWDGKPIGGFADLGLVLPWVSDGSERRTLPRQFTGGSLPLAYPVPWSGGASSASRPSYQYLQRLRR